MKSVGKQLQEARQAKNWTPELAARETKIKVDRIVDLEADDYGHFSSPTYARGFVRTYARALGIDEYRLLRQLDNKLPEDDNATFVQDAGLPYVPETSQMVHASSSHRTGLYVFVGLAVAVLVVSAFVVFQAYRAGELPRYFANTPDSAPAPVTNAAPVADAEAPQHALPVDPNDTSHAPKAVAVDLGQTPADTNSAPAVPATPATTNTAAATPAPAAPAAPDSDTIPGAPRALPVDLSQLTAAGANSAPVVPPVAQPVAPPAVTAAVPATPADAPPSEAAASPATANDDTSHAPRALPVDLSQIAANNSTPPPAPDAAATGAPASNSSGQVVTPVDISNDRPVQESMAEAQAKKQLVLTASRDSFIRVTEVNDPQNQPVLYASVLRAGQSVALSGRKFSVNVGIPSAVDIALDGVNYGPHSEGNSPETFTIESHQP
jgi:cytoskeleton protein RodZ